MNNFIDLKNMIIGLCFSKSNAELCNMQLVYLAQFWHKSLFLFLNTVFQFSYRKHSHWYMCLSNVHACMLSKFWGIY